MLGIEDKSINLSLIRKCSQSAILFTAQKETEAIILIALPTEDADDVCNVPFEPAAIALFYYAAWRHCGSPAVCIYGY